MPENHRRIEPNEVTQSRRGRGLALRLDRERSRRRARPHHLRVPPVLDRRLERRDHQAQEAAREVPAAGQHREVRGPPDRPAHGQCAAGRQDAGGHHGRHAFAGGDHEAQDRGHPPRLDPDVQQRSELQQDRGACRRARLRERGGGRRVADRQAVRGASRHVCEPLRRCGDLQGRIQALQAAQHDHRG